MNKMTKKDNKESQQYTSLTDFYSQFPQKKTEKEVASIMKRKEKDAERKVREMVRRENERKRQEESDAQWNIRLAWNPKSIIWRKETKKAEVVTREMPKKAWVKKQKPQLSEFNVNSSSFAPTTAVPVENTHAAKLCKYFAEGKCKFGEKCVYSHQHLTQTAVRTINQVTALEHQYEVANRHIMVAVVAENPKHKELVGNMIFPYVFQLVNIQAPSIIAMILEYCPVEDLRAILMDYRHLVCRVAQALDSEVKREEAGKEAQKHETNAADIDDNISEATQASDISQKEDDVNITTTTQQSDENDHKLAFFAWTESKNKEQV